ncbi:MAG TPA: MFS transporter [Candidatus Kapabacteria bacterium]|nr:MFS transporter [Candidatus Kapabacteria bacterium]
MIRDVPTGFPHFRRNYLLGIANGLFFNAGLSFFSKTTIIPVFLASLNAPSVMISLTAHFETLGWHLPQLLAAVYIAHRSRTMPFYRAASFIRFVGLLLAILSAWLALKSVPMALGCFVLGYLLFALAGGFSGIVFLELVAKTTPKERRGTYFGWRAITSGIAGLILGVSVIAPIFTGFGYPCSYVVSFTCGSILIGLSFVLLSRVKEPASTSIPQRRTVAEQMRTALAILRRDRIFRRFVLFRSLLMFCFAGMPFYMLFAKDNLGATDATMGTYISWEFAGLVVANLFWGVLSNRVGNRTVLRIACGLALLGSTIALCYAAHWFALPTWAFGLIFFLNAAVDSGIGNGGINYALEIVPELDRPTYIGLMNTVIAMVLLATAGVAASLRDIVGYDGLFGLASAVAFVGLLVIARLPEPRRTAPVPA